MRFPPKNLCKTAFFVDLRFFVLPKILVFGLLFYHVFFGSNTGWASEAQWLKQCWTLNITSIRLVFSTQSHGEKRMVLFLKRWQSTYTPEDGKTHGSWRDTGYPFLEKVRNIDPPKLTANFQGLTPGFGLRFASLVLGKVVVESKTITLNLNQSINQVLNGTNMNVIL